MKAHSLTVFSSKNVSKKVEFCKLTVTHCCQVEKEKQQTEHCGACNKDFCMDCSWWNTESQKCVICTVAQEVTSNFFWEGNVFLGWGWGWPHYGVFRKETQNAEKIENQWGTSENSPIGGRYEPIVPQRACRRCDRSDNFVHRWKSCQIHDFGEEFWEFIIQEKKNAGEEMEGKSWLHITGDQKYYQR